MDIPLFSEEERSTSRVCVVCRATDKKFIRQEEYNAQDTLVNSKIIVMGFICFWCDQGNMNHEKYATWRKKTRNGTIHCDPTIRPDEIPNIKKMLPIITTQPRTRDSLTMAKSFPVSTTRTLRTAAALTVRLASNKANVKFARRMYEIMQKFAGDDDGLKKIEMMIAEEIAKYQKAKGFDLDESIRMMVNIGKDLSRKDKDSDLVKYLHDQSKRNVKRLYCP